jgi:all-trans-8'-apo-beta-carotenal 15,15'-oxygenase
MVEAAQLARDWAAGYRSQPDEHSGWIAEVEGAIPPELHGTLFRNGPGLLEVGGHPLHHPFDGDGLVASFSFRDGRAFYRSRFVQTEGYLAERAAGRPLYRGVFGSQIPGGMLANIFNLTRKNIANTGVLHWGGRTLALWEAAEPHRLDPRTLDTLGLDRLDGLLRQGEPFAAHYHVDPFCHWDGGAPALVNFGVDPGLNTTITLFEFDPSFRCVRQQAFQLDGFAFLHDMAITPNYVLFVQNPVRYDPIPYALGLQGAAQGLASVPGRPSTIFVIPRHQSLGEPRSFRAPEGFVWHHANAFEAGDTIVLDSIWYDSYVGIDPATDFRQIEFERLPPGRLARCVLDVRSGAVERHLIDTRCCEFPVLHPARVGRPHRFLYMAAAAKPTGNAPLQAVWKLDLEAGTQQLWSAAPRGFVSEPIFVPRPRRPELAAAVTPDLGDVLEHSAPDEDDGWLLALVYDAARHATSLVILDARDLERGPLARLWLDHHLPHGLHGTFTSSYYGPVE